MKLTTSTKQLFIRLLVFFALFGALSGIIGPWVIRTRLLYGFHFFIYGNMGKVLLIGVIAFLFMVKGKLGQLTIAKYERKYLLFVALSGLLAFMFIPTAKLLLGETSFDSNLPLSLFTHLILMMSVVSLGVGVFTVKFAVDFTKLFRREVLICLGLSVFLYFMIFQVWKLWPIFSGVVLNASYFVFKIIFPGVYIIPPRTLSVSGFSVEIAQACSGVDSLFLFTVLYWFFGLVDWKEFNKKKLIGMFLPAAFGLFCVNILRIFLLMFIGVMISRELALNLFHTYAGLVMFMIYFGIFWKLFYRWLKR